MIERAALETARTGRIPGWEWAAIGGITLVAGWLRLRGIEHAPFGRDAVHMIEMADRLLGGEAILVGIPTSKGMRNPPLSIWMIAVLRATVGTPLRMAMATAVLNVLAVAGTWWVARRRWGSGVGLAAAAMFAVSAWAVLYSRAIWQQDFIPPLAVGALGALLAWTVDRKPWALAVALVLAGAVSQLHLTGFAWFAVIAALAVAVRPPLKAAPIATGLGACALLYAPFVYAALLGEVAAPGGKRGPSALFVDFVGTPVRVALGSATHGGISFDLPTAAEALAARLPAAVTLGFAVVPWIAAALVVIGLSRVFPRRRDVRKTDDLLLFRVGGDPAAITLAVWTVLPVAAMVAVGLSTHPHYAIILFPAVWILGALGAASAAGRFAMRRIRPARAAAALVSALVALEGGYVLALQQWIAVDPRRPGGYGPTLAHQLDAARWIAEDVGGADAVVAAVPFPERSGAAAPRESIAWLVAEMDRSGGSTSLPPVRYVVLDEADATLSPEASAVLQARGMRRFGPLLVTRWE